MIRDGQRLLEPEEAAEEFPKILRSKPSQMLTRFQLVTPRSPGKTSTAFMSVFTILAAIAGHTQRLRGRYVHAHKGKYLRRHTQRTSELDAC